MYLSDQIIIFTSEQFVSFLKYSMYGHIQTLAKAQIKGLERAGGE